MTYDSLNSETALNLFISSNDPVARQHAAILKLAARTSIKNAQAVVTTPGVAAEQALAALDRASRPGTPERVMRRQLR